MIAVECILIQPPNSENPGCTQANQGCGEQHPAHQLKPLREWCSHGLSVEWVDPHQLLRRNSSRWTVDVSTDSFCLHTLKAKQGLAMGNPAAHARVMQPKTSEGLEVLAAVVVTAGLVVGNLVLFSPLRVDLSLIHI